MAARFNAPGGIVIDTEKLKLAFAIKLIHEHEHYDRVGLTTRI